MIEVHTFTFGPFQENTYLLSDESNECIVIDPGCFDAYEQMELANYIETKKLKPIQLINTHCHIDHVAGNKFIADKYQLPLFIHHLDLTILHNMNRVAQMYGLPPVDESPEPTGYYNEGDIISFGNSELEIYFTPGHSPGSISFYNKKQKIIIAGDVLFNGSIGRTDLPGGDYDTLINSIKTKLLPLGDEFIVYSGHGPTTTIGNERKYNPFLNQ